MRLMIGRNAALLAVAGTLCVSLPVTAVDAPPLIIHGPAAVAQAIAETDRAFSARSAAIGTAKAFRDFMDGKDGLEFAGGEPKRGAQEIFNAHGGDSPPKSVLTWEPAEVFGQRRSRRDLGSLAAETQRSGEKAANRPLRHRLAQVARRRLERRDRYRR